MRHPEPPVRVGLTGKFADGKGRLSPR
jgi:hypothetical protein